MKHRLAVAKLGGVVVVAALSLAMTFGCSDPVDAPDDIPEVVEVGGLRFAANTSIPTPGSVETVLSITNIGVSADTVRLAGCPFRRLAYTSPTLTGTPVWDELTTRPPCPASEQIVVISPGETKTATWYASTTQVVSSTNLRGVFYLKTIVEPVGRPSITLRSGKVLIT